MKKHTKHTRAHGLWQFQNEIAFKDDGGKHAHDVFTFAYDGEHITMRLVTLHPGQWKSADDFYKLESKWEGYLSHYSTAFWPLDRTRELRGRPFCQRWQWQEAHLRQGPLSAQVIPWNAAILASKRGLHDYRMQPDGSLKASP